MMGLTRLVESDPSALLGNMSFSTFGDNFCCLV